MFPDSHPFTLGSNVPLQILIRSKSPSARTPLPAALEPAVRPTLDARDRLHLFERQRYCAAAEEPLAGAEHHREGEQPILVDQVILQQRLERVGAAPGPWEPVLDCAEFKLPQRPHPS